MPTIQPRSVTAENRSASNLHALRRDRWTGGQLLAFSALDGATDYERGLTLRTTAAPAGIVVVWPQSDPSAARCQLRWLQQPLGDVLITSDTFEFRTQNGWTRGVLLDAYHLLVEGDVEIVAPHADLTVRREGTRVLVGSAARFAPELLQADLDHALRLRRAWLETQALQGEYSGSRASTRLKALSVMKGQVCSPQGSIATRWTTPDRWPHQDMWLWDSAFHAIGWRHVDPAIARDALDAVFAVQQDDGFIPYRIGPKKQFQRLTQPPVLALAVTLVNAAAPDRAWLSRVYPVLANFMRWVLANRDRDDSGCLEWEFETTENCRCGESGMDNSPRFDQGTLLDATDLSAYVGHECELLADMAKRLGLDEQAKTWRDQHTKICTAISAKLWDARAGFYFDRDTQTDRSTGVIASSGFLPLLCGACTREQADRLAAHLRDPEMFAAPLPVPSIAVCDREHYSKDMWRGPVWVNVNWMIARGLDRYGHHDLATWIRQATTTEIERQCERWGTLFEYYDDRLETDPPALLRKGICDPNNAYRQVIHDYGWTCTLYLDLVSDQAIALP